MSNMTIGHPPLVLDSICQDIIRNHKLAPFIGIELEFYITDSDQATTQLLTQLLLQESAKLSLPVEAIKEEEGEGQYEVVFSPQLNVVQLAAQVESFKQMSQNLAQLHDHQLTFLAKPYDDRPGCGMHVHVNLLNEQGVNVFSKVDEQTESQQMLASIAGLLELMPASMVYLAPDEACYLRYNKDALREEDGKRVIQTPKTLSWGGNNRTVALRIPESTMQEHTRRIEHRVPSAHANPHDVLAVVLLGIHHGITQELKPTMPRVYGNAWDAHYEPIWLPQSLGEAKMQHHAVFEGLKGA